MNLLLKTIAILIFIAVVCLWWQPAVPESIHDDPKIWFTFLGGLLAFNLIGLWTFNGIDHYFPKKKKEPKKGNTLYVGNSNSRGLISSLPPEIVAQVLRKEMEPLASPTVSPEVYFKLWERINSVLVHQPELDIVQGKVVRRDFWAEVRLYRPEPEAGQEEK